MSEWLTPEEAAQHLSITVQDLAGLRRLGGPRYAQKGNLIRYRRADLDEWMAADQDPDNSEGWEIKEPPTNSSDDNADFDSSNEGPKQEVDLPAKTIYAEVARRGTVTVRTEDGNEIELPDPMANMPPGWAPAGVGIAPPHIVEDARRGISRGGSPLEMSRDQIYTMLEDMRAGRGEWSDAERQRAIPALQDALNRS